MALGTIITRTLKDGALPAYYLLTTWKSVGKSESVLVLIALVLLGFLVRPARLELATF
jgi:hypothetical protein